MDFDKLNELIFLKTIYYFLKIIFQARKIKKLKRTLQKVLFG